MKLTRKKIYITSGCVLGVLFITASVLTIIQPPRTIGNGEYITKMTLSALYEKYTDFKYVTKINNEIVETIQFNTSEYFLYSLKDTLTPSNNKFVQIKDGEVKHENVELADYEDETIKKYVTDTKNSFLKEYYIKNIYDGGMIQGLEGMYDVNYTKDYLGIYETDDASYKYNFDGLVTEITYKSGKHVLLEIVD